MGTAGRGRRVRVPPRRVLVGGCDPRDPAAAPRQPQLPLSRLRALAGDVPPRTPFGAGGDIERRARVAAADVLRTQPGGEGRAAQGLALGRTRAAALRGRRPVLIRTHADPTTTTTTTTTTTRRSWRIAPTPRRTTWRTWT